MSVITDYARNIAVFLVFISFIGIIMPSDKYKKYINLISGFVLMMIVIVPIGIITSGNEISIDSIYTDMEIKLNRNIIEREKDYYEDIKYQMVMDAYKSDLELQMKSIIVNKGFNPLEIEVKVDESDENFGAIQWIYAEVSNERTDDTTRPIIQIEKIQIGPALSSVYRNNESADENYEESLEIKNLKNYFSDFYNLSLDNIHIKERKNMD